MNIIIDVMNLLEMPYKDYINIKCRKIRDIIQFCYKNIKFM